MLRANQVIGLPVFTLDNHQIGTVKDVAYGATPDRVVGFLLSDADRDALPFESITRIAADTVVVPDQSALVNPEDVPEIHNAVNSSVKINGLKVVDQNGDTLGEVEDTFIDERSGRILGFQVDPEEDLSDAPEDVRQRGKLFVPIGKLGDLNQDQNQVTYAARVRDVYNERYPEEYWEERAA